MHLWTITRYEYGSDHRSYEHYLNSSSNSSDNKVWKEKFRPVRDLNPWPLLYRCSALQPAQAWIFFRPYFYYYLSSVYNCEGRLHIRFFSRSSHTWFSKIYMFYIFWTKSNSDQSIKKVYRFCPILLSFEPKKVTLDLFVTPFIQVFLFTRDWGLVKPESLKHPPGYTKGLLVQLTPTFLTSESVAVGTTYVIPSKLI